MSRLKPGSPFLFGLIKLLNVVFALTGVTMVALSILLIAKFKAFNVVELFFIAMGLYELFLVFIVFTAKKSVFRLRIYFYLLFILFIGALVLVIVVFATGDSILQKVAQNSSQQIDQIKKYLYVANYFCVATLSLMIVMLFFTYCYIGSLRQRNNQFDYKFIDEDGNKMTVQEKTNMDKGKIKQKYDLKRQQLNKKYRNNE